jgi:predicted MFS family arabinose efflux permease
MTFSTKKAFILALVVFEIGSLMCALSPSSPVLIVGRAVQGVGSTGILTGVFVVCTYSVRLQTRPVLFAFVGILYALGALCGPLLGGAFTNTIGWRWCFWINLPYGLITFVAVFFFFKKSEHKKETPSFVNRILSLDLVGNAILLGAATQLFLTLQMSEARVSWSSAPVIGLLCGFGVTTIIFIAWILFRGEAALLPPRIVGQRTVAASYGAAFFIYGTLLLHSYYLPVYFQAIHNASALESGVDMVPYMAASAVTPLLAGIFVWKNGLFAPPAIIGCAIGTVGCGLIATFKVGTSTATWVGYIILTSGGIGMAIQQGFSAVQTVLPLCEVPIGTAAVVACQTMGGAIFVSVGNTLLQNHLLSDSAAKQVPGVDLRVIIEEGTTHFRQHVPADVLPDLVRLYSDALQGVFIAAVPLLGCALLCSLCMEWRSVKRESDVSSETRVEKTVYFSHCTWLNPELLTHECHAEHKLHRQGRLSSLQRSLGTAHRTCYALKHDCRPPRSFADFA